MLQYKGNEEIFKILHSFLVMNQICDIYWRSDVLDSIEARDALWIMLEYINRFYTNSMQLDCYCCYSKDNHTCILEKESAYPVL